LFEHRIRDLERVEAEEKRKSRETQRRFAFAFAFPSARPPRLLHSSDVPWPSCSVCRARVVCGAAACRQYRKNRDAFRALLREAYDAGKLDRNSKWKRFKRTIKEDPRYEDLIGQPGYLTLPFFNHPNFRDRSTLRVRPLTRPGACSLHHRSSTPSELYGDFVEDLQERYEETKRIIDRITKVCSCSLALVCVCVCG
jgi:hypothetical protein